MLTNCCFRLEFLDVRRAVLESRGMNNNAESIRALLLTNLGVDMGMSDEHRVDIEFLSTALYWTLEWFVSKMDLFVKRKRSGCRKVLPTLITTSLEER